MRTQTGKARSAKTNLSSVDLQVGGGVEPGDVPEAARRVSTSWLRDLGLPFECKGGEIVEDACTTAVNDDLGGDGDLERESREVLFVLDGECLSVGYTRPVDIAIAAKFEPWPDEAEVLLTLHEEDEFGTWHMRTVGEEAPLH
jgi:hypothetical protein